MSCGPIRHTLGIYVLGAIDPAERAEVDAHLAQCVLCRDELASLAGLPALLGRVPAGEVALGEARSSDADPALLDRLLARAGATRRRYRRRVAAAAAAALILAGGGLAGAYVAGEQVQRQPAPTSVAVSAADRDSGVWGKVTLSGRAWGTNVSVRLTGVPRSTTCRLVAVGAGGTRSVAASWQVNYRGGITVDGGTALYPGQITEFEVVTSKGRELLTIPAPSGDDSTGGSGSW